MNFSERRKQRRSLNVRTYEWFFYYPFILIFAIFANYSNINASTPPAPKNHYGTGAKEMTEKQIQKIKKTSPQIIGVRPNKLGLSRIQKHLQLSGLKLDANIAA